MAKSKQARKAKNALQKPVRLAERSEQLSALSVKEVEPIVQLGTVLSDFVVTDDIIGHTVHTIESVQLGDS